jgi:hypothetical protein
MNRSDENWALARSIQLTPVHEGLTPGCHGVVVAERHPTGWFILAGFDPEVPADLVDDFAHFVVVRTYLLLQYGPRPGTWEAGTAGVWRANCPTLTADLKELPLNG